MRHRPKKRKAQNKSAVHKKRKAQNVRLFLKIAINQPFLNGFSKFKLCYDRDNKTNKFYK